MEFWNSILTEKSWNHLKELSTHKLKFVLIGGWAAYMWTRMHKSKDIDIVLSDLKELDVLKQGYEIRKNDRLKKYEIKLEEIDVDVYVPYFSSLTVPVEDIPKHSTMIENIPVAKPEMLLILKQGAELDRKDSVKGQKDRIDIVTLLCFAEIDFKEYFRLLEHYHKETFAARLQQIIREFTEIKYLGLNPREFKLKKEQIIGALKTDSKTNHKPNHL